MKNLAQLNWGGLEVDIHQRSGEKPNLRSDNDNPWLTVDDGGLVIVVPYWHVDRCADWHLWMLGVKFDDLTSNFLDAEKYCDSAEDAKADRERILKALRDTIARIESTPIAAAGSKSE